MTSRASASDNVIRARMSRSYRIFKNEVSYYKYLINRDYYMAIFILCPISNLGLVWVSRVDMGYDMKIAIS